MRIITLFLLVFNTFLTNAKSPLQEKYPHGLLSDDYGLLNEADLIYETKRARETPYQIEDGTSAYQRWQCFETKKVLFKYSAWQELDSDFGKGISILCDYSFRLTDKTGIKHMYYARKSWPLETCREAFHEWKRVRKNSKYVCIIGEASSYENKEKGWVWGKTKTKNGCMSYFLGECDSEKKLKEYEKEK
jgi:hypothetical protein